MPLFEKTYGVKNALKWWVYWRIFFMACAELWKYKNGNEWFVSHYLFENRPVSIVKNEIQFEEEVWNQ